VLLASTMLTRMIVEWADFRGHARWIAVARDAQIASDDEIAVFAPMHAALRLATGRVAAALLQRTDNEALNPLGIAATDGHMLTRALLGFGGGSVTNSALGANAQRNSWSAIRDHLEGHCGLSGLAP
jgi:hypothetical protein